MQKIVLLTGASSGLGGVISKYLAENGYKVYAGYNRNKSNLSSKSIVPVSLDVTDESSSKKAVSQIVKNEKRLDVLINVAGITKVGKFEESKLSEFDQLLDVNVKGVYRIIKEVIPIMRKQKGGRIINISSMSGLISFPNFGIYSASKFALEGLTTALRYEVFKDNIWVTNIEPGAIKKETEGVVKMPHKTFREKFPIVASLLPLVTPGSIAKVILKIVESGKPPANVLLGNDVRITYLLKRLMPSLLFDRLLMYIWRN